MFSIVWSSRLVLSRYLLSSDPNIDPHSLDVVLLFLWEISHHTVSQYFLILILIQLLWWLWCQDHLLIHYFDKTRTVFIIPNDPLRSRKTIPVNNAAAVQQHKVWPTDRQTDAFFFHTSRILLFSKVLVSKMLFLGFCFHQYRKETMLLLITKLFMGRVEGLRSISI